MSCFSVLTVLICGVLSAGPSPGDQRANVPVTMEDGAWHLHVPPSHQGTVELRFVDKPDTVTELATGKTLSFTHNAGTLAIEPPAASNPQGTVIAVTWRNQRWDKDMQAFAELDLKQPPAQGGILFVGSSTIRIWNLSDSFPDLHALNRGFGGSTYADAVYHLKRVILPYHPATIVIYDGDNDIAGGKTPEWVFADFEALMHGIRSSLPETRIIVLSIKPCPARWPLWDKMQKTNAMIKEYLGKQDKMQYVDLTASMLGPDGTPRSEIFQKDGLHFNAQGYALCAAQLKPVLSSAGG